MEQVHGTCKASKSEPVDVISSMPDNVITNILDRLPLQEAVRTDILSRNWRYKWTMLTQLVFDRKFFEYLKRRRSKCFGGRDLGRLLLHVNGAITKFFLDTPDRHILTDEDINHWVLFVCRKGIKDLTLINTCSEKPPKLPSQLSFCMELELLKIRDCFLCFLPTFCGFPNLLSLDLTMVKFGSYECVEFIAQCPLLEILKIVDFEYTGKLRLSVIEKLVNLKILHLSLLVLDETTENTSSGVLQLMSSLPKLQEFNLDFWGCKFTAEASVTNKFPATFPCLKTLILRGIDFSSDKTIFFVIELISGSPNLQNLMITVTYNRDDGRLHAPSSLDFDCNTMGQLQLQRVELDGIKGSDSEALLIKYILACSPLLKKIVIESESSLIHGYSGKFSFASKLLKFHRASTVAEIDLS